MGKTSRNDASPNSKLKEHRTEENLTEAHKTVRETFVFEYVKDFNATNAILRMGQAGTIQYIRKKGSEFLREPYVQKLIDKYLSETKEDSIVTRQRVLAGLTKEANNAIESSVRVTAWCNIGKMLGMYIEKKEVKVTGSGVMLVPVAGTPDEWEAGASAAQQALKDQAAHHDGG